MTRAQRPPQRGVSLIEALVAMTVMAFGMLGVAGIQATLRGNSDIAKQRSEAVRIAQAAMESRRAFSVLDSAGGVVAYADIQQVANDPVVQDNPNANFASTLTVRTFPVDGEANHVAPHKSLRVDVGWTDRAGTAQGVRLSSIVSGTAPEMAAALSTPPSGSPLQGAGGRHRAIPPGAVDRTGADAGTSRFAPPGAATGFAWIFSNATGFITQVCAADLCTAFNARLLTGYVRFATTAAPPTAAHARVPPDTSAIAGVGVVVTLADSTAVACYTSTTVAPGAIAYYCAVPVGTGTSWSGRSTVTGLTLAANATDATASAHRVCRYTTSRWNTATPLVPNEEHPYTYHTVETSLTHQNFLVIRAGSGSTLYACPNDTDVLGRTFDHQPWP